ncbi:hypothetical protein EVAR_66259_1 [Eumeta japonica]|uniref:Histone-lysine N-methyltransferase SETMAR n=1 Tax=Eumeta variegata TaxID=151549 RepID=A0A4C1ZW63_EUMVA|nr:hypothetical protein EVAR_66259_1 [Eumeta japonica]
MSVRVAQNVFKRFQFGNFDVKDEPLSGRPVTDKVDAILEKVERDRHISSYNIAEELGIEHKTVLKIYKKARYSGTTRAHRNKFNESCTHLRFSTERLLKIKFLVARLVNESYTGKSVRPTLLKQRDEDQREGACKRVLGAEERVFLCLSLARLQASSRNGFAEFRTALGDEAPCKKIIYNSFEELKRGRVNLNDKFRDGRPTTL